MGAGGVRRGRPGERGFTALSSSFTLGVSGWGMTDDLKDTTPLGKSVEEIEETTQNRVNSSAPGEERRDDGGLPVGLASTTVAGLGVGSGAMVGAVGTTLEPGDGSGKADGTARSGDATDNGQA